MCCFPFDSLKVTWTGLLYKWGIKPPISLFFVAWLPLLPSLLASFWLGWWSSSSSPSLLSLLDLLLLDGVGVPADVLLDVSMAFLDDVGVKAS